MSQKKISIVLNNELEQRTSKILAAQLRLVFDESISINTYYMDSLSMQNKLDDDLFLIPSESGLFRLLDFVEDRSKIMLINRVPSKSGIAKMLDIPKFSNVLVVNYTDEATQNCVNSLYELNLNQWNFIVFSHTNEEWKKYKHIHYAITPGEKELIPSFIKNIVDIGHRMIDSYTMSRIASKLGAGHKKVRLNLIKYLDLLAEPETVIKDYFISNFLHAEMLKTYIQNSGDGMVLCDMSHNIIYKNKEFDKIFYNSSKISLQKCFGDRLFSTIFDDDNLDIVTYIEKTVYQISKKYITISGEVLGIHLVFRNENSIRELESKLHNKFIKSGFYAKYKFSDIIYESNCMDECINMAKKAAKSDHSIVIYGESGTGKELLAQSIHNYSSRWNKQFVAINCAAMPESLLESELFGYEKGSFTGARREGKVGLFEQANGGSFFLDEISEMPLSIQSKLLRVLQEKQIMRIGSDKVISIDIRIIAASNKDLNAEIEKRCFREDLFYRINTLPIKLPPLRKRGNDIKLLLQSVLGTEYATIGANNMEKIMTYHWPGNVRQLYNAAHFYKVMQNFQCIFDESFSKTSSISSNDDVEDLVLRVIHAHTTPSHGIGRMALYQIMQNQHAIMSDNKLRILLKKLSTLQYITIGKGRAGCMITKEGQEKIGCSDSVMQAALKA